MNKLETTLLYLGRLGCSIRLSLSNITARNDRLRFIRRTSHVRPINYVKVFFNITVLLIGYIVGFRAFADRTHRSVTTVTSILVVAFSGARRYGFLQNTLKTLFRLCRVLLDIQKCILSGATKLLSVWSSKGNLSLFEITRASALFSENFRCNLTFYGSENFLILLSIIFQDPKILGFLFLRKIV